MVCSKTFKVISALALLVSSFALGCSDDYPWDTDEEDGGLQIEKIAYTGTDEDNNGMPNLWSSILADEMYKEAKKQIHNGRDYSFITNVYTQAMTKLNEGVDYQVVRSWFYLAISTST